MSSDHVDVIQAESDRIVAALEERRDGPVPWCGAWTVQDVAQHVGGAHHVVAKVIAGRPTTNFGVFRDLELPSAGDPGLGRWLSDGTAALIEQLRTTDPDAETWSWWPTGRNVGFWARRMVQETLVHRWDAERGAGLDVAPMDPCDRCGRRRRVPRRLRRTDTSPEHRSGRWGVGADHLDRHRRPLVDRLSRARPVGADPRPW